MIFKIIFPLAGLTPGPLRGAPLVGVVVVVVVAVVVAVVVVAVVDGAVGFVALLHQEHQQQPTTSTT